MEFEREEFLKAYKKQFLKNFKRRRFIKIMSFRA